MTCPVCSYANHADAPFCLECGATLSLNNDDGASLAPLNPLIVEDGRAGVVSSHRAAPTLPTLLSPLRWSMELRIVVALLLLLAGFQFMVNQGVGSETTAYDAARAAIAHKQWHLAARQLAPLAASGFRDARSQLADVNKQVTAFDSMWQDGLAAKAAGDKGRALRDFLAAERIEPNYAGLSDQIAAARVAAGLIILRDNSTNGVLSVSDLAGVEQWFYLGTDANTRILAIAGDGRQFLVGNLRSSRTLSNSLSLDLVLFDAATNFDRGFSIPISGTALFRSDDLIASYQAAFFKGGVVVSEGGFGDRSDTPGGFRCWTFDAEGNLHQFHASLIARPNPDDDALYFVDSSDWGSDAILSHTPGSLGEYYQQVTGKTITHLYAVNHHLLYSTYTQDEVAIYMVQQPMRTSRELLKLPTSSVGIIYGSLSLYIQPSPDGHSAFLTVPNGNHYILNLDDRRLYGLANLPSGGHCSVRFSTFSPDGQHLLLGGVIFYSALSPSSEGPRYDWIAVSDLNGKLNNVTTFTGSIDGGGFLNSDTVYYYRSYGNSGPGNNSEVVVTPISSLATATPLLGFNLQAAGDWTPYPLSGTDNHMLVLAGQMGNSVGVYAVDAGVTSKLPPDKQVPAGNNNIYYIGTDNIGTNGSVSSLAPNATSVWSLKSEQVTPAGFP